MTTIRIKGDKSSYSVYDRHCLGRKCLTLGHYQTRGATMSGSRNTGDSSPCCLTRAYHGCPSDTVDLYQIDPELLKTRSIQGMKSY